MAKKKEEKLEENTIPSLEDLKIPEPMLMDGLWIPLLLALLFTQPVKPAKVINIYMGDE